jgi:hypothetical protein
MKKTTFGQIVENRGSFPDPLNETKRKMSKKDGKHSRDVRVTKREIHGRVTVPWVVLEFDIKTSTQRPISATKYKEKRI